MLIALMAGFLTNGNYTHFPKLHLRGPGSSTLKAFHSEAQGCPTNVGLPWRPARAGIELKHAPDAPAPAQSDRQRLVQMRSIVEEYKAIDDFEDKQSRWELRLLAKPVYRP